METEERVDQNNNDGNEEVALITEYIDDANDDLFDDVFGIPVSLQLINQYQQ